jgi:hypothetical protein
MYLPNQILRTRDLELFGFGAAISQWMVVSIPVVVTTRISDDNHGHTTVRGSSLSPK